LRGQKGVYGAIDESSTAARHLSQQRCRAAVVVNLARPVQAQPADGTPVIAWPKRRRLPGSYVDFADRIRS
jgi:hypothetical protein